MENTLEKNGLQTPVKVHHAAQEPGWVASSWQAFTAAFRVVHDPDQPDPRGDTLEQISRGFLPLVALRVLTVVNDNVLRWLAIGLGKKAVAESQVWLVLTIGTAGFVLPFVALAWLAGYLADRHPKRSVIVWCKFAEIVIAAAAAAAVAWGVRSGGTYLGLPVGLWLLLASVVVIGCQAALLAPSVIGTIPESVPAGRLSNANGLFAMATLAATLVGMAGGNWLADGTPVPGPGELHSAPPWAHAVPAAVALVGLAAAGWLAALWLVPRPAADPTAPAPWNALARTKDDLVELFQSRELAAAAAGIVFFWALGAVAQLNVDQYATEAGATSQGQIVPLLLALVSGIGLGSLLAGRLSGRGVNLGLVPAGGGLMAVASFFLAFSPPTIFGAGAGFAWWSAAAALLFLGIGAGMFDVPLEAAFQERSPAARRGALLAATNLLTFAGMFAASTLYGAIRSPVGEAARPLLSARGIFGIFGILALGAAAVAIYAAPRASLRAFVSAIVHSFYRFRVRGEECLPATGPAVIVANHLSWLDGFIVVLASPRPVRMVVYGPNIRGKFLRMLSDQWRFILFDPRPKSIGQALKTIQSGLADGDVIGIFCEGGISRTGQILGFKRGLEWLLDRVEAPIVPLHIDGMWGSLLSFSEGRYFTKWPRLFFGGGLAGFRRPLTLRFGPALPVGAHPNDARLALQELTATSVRERMRTAWRGGPTGADWAAFAATAEAFDGACLLRRGDRMLASLAAGDPLHDSLGTHGGRLLRIEARVIDGAHASSRDLRGLLARERHSIWLARIDQVAAVALLPADDDAPLPPLRGTLEAVVMPIDDLADLPRATQAAAAFLERHGVEPVVAFAPREARGLVAMNSPPARAVADHEVTLKRDTVGRVLNGVVVWPRASDRERLGRNPLPGGGIAAGEGRTLVIGATLPQAPESAAPAAVLLDDAFDVDSDGFLVPRES
jgi:1-acyl-sn-glycerol-3-phosphate acyltransferase